MPISTTSTTICTRPRHDAPIDPEALLTSILRDWRLIAGLTPLAGALGMGGRASAAVAKLGRLVSLTRRTPGRLEGAADRHIASMQSATIFDPEALDRPTVIREAKDWTRILHQFGIGVAPPDTLR